MSLTPDSRVLAPAPPRRGDWPERLAAWLEGQRRAPPVFAWGETDCVLWAAAWVVEATGEDPVPGLRGRYSDAKGARRALRAELRRAKLSAARGAALGRLLEVMIDARFERLATPLLAQRGDLVGARGPGGAGGEDLCLGVCLGETFLALNRDSGVSEWPLGEALAAWRI